MGKPIAIIPVSEVKARVERAGGSITRAAIYKALKGKRLTSGDLFGRMAVAQDGKLRRFIKAAKSRNGD